MDIPVKPLSQSDRRHVEAANGWCRLESFQEATAELEQITLENQGHPDVLEVRWQICANLGKWPDALEFATAVAVQAPGKPDGWIYKASALHELGRNPEAHEVLIEAAKRFPDDEIILYDLACVCCLLK